MSQKMIGTAEFLGRSTWYVLVAVQSASTELRAGAVLSAASADGSAQIRLSLKFSQLG